MDEPIFDPAAHRQAQPDYLVHYDLRGKSVTEPRFDRFEGDRLFDELNIPQEDRAETSIRFRNRYMGFVAAGSLRVNNEDDSTPQPHTDSRGNLLSRAWKHVRNIGKSSEAVERRDALENQHSQAKYQIDINVSPWSKRLTTKTLLHETKRLADIIHGRNIEDDERAKRQKRFIKAGIAIGAVASAVTMGPGAMLLEPSNLIRTANWMATGGLTGFLAGWRSSKDERRTFKFINNRGVMNRYGETFNYDINNPVRERALRIGAFVTRKAHSTVDRLRARQPVYEVPFVPVH